MGPYAMGHWGIMTGGLHVVDYGPSDLPGLLPVITAVVCGRISTNAHMNVHL